VSAPSPVMAATDDRDTYFYVHTLAVGTDGKLRLLEPDRIDLRGLQIADDSSATRTESEYTSTLMARSGTHNESSSLGPRMCLWSQ
jgi:hypothetical protein